MSEGSPRRRGPSRSGPTSASSSRSTAPTPVRSTRKCSPPSLTRTACVCGSGSRRSPRRSPTRSPAHRGVSRPGLASCAAIPPPRSPPRCRRCGHRTGPTNRARAGPLPDPGETPPIAFRHLGTSDGLSNSAVLSVTQDALGFIWIGTADGLDRYDGEVDPAVPSRRVRRVAHQQRRAGPRAGPRRRRVGGDGGRPRPLRPGDRAVRVRRGSAGRDVLELLADTTGGVWVGTTNGLVRVSPTGEALSTYRHDARGRQRRSPTTPSVPSPSMGTGSGWGPPTASRTSRSPPAPSNGSAPTRSV